MNNLFTNWCDLFDKSNKEPMEDEIRKIFLMLSLMELKNESIPNEFKKHFLFQIIDKRSDYINLKMNDLVKSFLGCICSTPGCAVMYIYFLKSRIKSDEQLTMKKLSLFFPVGFPTKKSLDELWDKQKLDNGANLLDVVMVS